MSLTSLKSVLSEKSTQTTNNNAVTLSSSNVATQKVGLISVLDYVNASATLDCQSNFCLDNLVQHGH